MTKKFEDRVEERLDSIDVTMARNTESLEHHIKRTDELQEMVGFTTKHVIMIQGVFKATMAFVAISTAVAGIIAMFTR